MRRVGRGLKKVKRKFMIRLADPAERSTFTVVFRGQAFIGQVWVKMQIKSKPNARPASL